MRLTAVRRAGRPPPLWVLLLLSNMAFLALPITGLWAMRLYESALVRQTEAELVAQAAVWAAAYREELRRNAPDGSPPPAPQISPDGGVSPRAISIMQQPGLDLAVDPILPPPPDAMPASQQPDPEAAAIGRTLAPMIRDAQAVTLSALRLTDAHGVVVASTGPDIGLSLAGWDEVARVLGGAPVATSMRRREPVQAAIGSISRTSGLRVFVALPVDGAFGVAGAVVLSRTPRDALQAIWGKRWELAGLASFLFAMGVLLAAGLSRLVTRPLRVVVAQAQHAAVGGDIFPLMRPGTREVADLSAALTRMAATLDERARYVTAFAASVSHEFKTPLAGLRGAAELLEDHAATLPDEERAKLLAVIGTSTRRLHQLVQRLLELARADMMRPGVTMRTPLARVLDDLLPQYRARGMTIEADAGGAAVALSADALSALLASLLDNAAVYASSDGQGAGACVRIHATASEGRTRIDVADQGPGISPANRQHIFEPFFTTAREQGGTGVGLSIVRAIAVGAGGNVELVDSPGGAQFRVELPDGSKPQGRGTLERIPTAA